MTGASATTAVVLAGGRSRRFGDTPKATAMFDGTPLVDRAVERARAATHQPPVVAAGPPDKCAVVDDVLTQPVQYVDDVEWCDGPLAGLCGALSAVSTPAVFVCACDMPLVSPRTVSWLVARHASKDCDATVPVDETGEPQLLHAVYRTAALADYCGRRPETHCLRALVADLSVDRIPPTAGPPDVDLPASTTNVNTRAALAALGSE